MTNHWKGMEIFVVVWVIGFALGTVHFKKDILAILEAMERFGLVEMATMTRVWDIESGEDLKISIHL